MTNLWTDQWDSLGENDWEGGTKSKRVASGETVGASVYELPPGGSTAYHFHHGSEEILAALDDGLVVRTPDGDRTLARGDVLHFPRGPEGAHGQSNPGDAPIRYLVFGSRPSPEVVEYPDLGQITAQSILSSQAGERLFAIHQLVEPAAPAARARGPA
jgi:uncharacterized cupin superfamily protein